MSAAEGASEAGPSRRSTVAWVLYDLANDIFSLSIVSLYFPLWVVNVMGGTDQAYGNANGLSMALVFVSAPLLGALSDQAPRRLPFLVVSTVLCVACTLLLGVGGLSATLAVFVAANFFYQTGVIFYDALLADVSTPETRGRVGGLGVAIGYLGSVIGIVAGMAILAGDPTAYPAVFRATALLFLLFALPAFFLIRERPRAGTRFDLGAVRRAFAAVGQTLTRAGQYPGLRRFLIGRVFYADAANTVIAFMGIYVTNELGFTAQAAQLVLFAGIVGAVVSGYAWGAVVDRVGPKRALNVVLAAWTVVFALAAAIPWLGLPGGLFWGVAFGAGVCLAGTWAADRPYVLRLAPPRYLGQFYGLYAMVGRFAAIIGPLLWGFIVNTLGWGRPAAVASLLVMVVIAWAVLQGVSDTPRAWEADDLAET